jgi:hypothetical protein
MALHGACPQDNVARHQEHDYKLAVIPDMLSAKLSPEGIIDMSSGITIYLFYVEPILSWSTNQNVQACSASICILKRYPMERYLCKWCSRGGRSSAVRTRRA